MTSHYSREDAPLKRFLSPDLNVNRVYHLYLEAEEPEVLARQREITKTRQKQLPVPSPIKLTFGDGFYRKAFNSDFNLGFCLPCTDTCASCDKLNLVLKSDPSDTVAHQHLTDHQD